MRPTEPQSAIDGARELPDSFVEQLLATLHSHRDGHAPSNEAFVVSVFGEWGVGKTHCLKCVYQRLNEELMLALQALGPQAPTSSVPPLIIPVPFDAWRYERDEHLVVPLLKTLEQRLLQIASSDERRVEGQTDRFILENEALGRTLLNAGRALGLVAEALLGTVSGKVNLGVVEAEIKGDRLVKLWKELRAHQPPEPKKRSLFARWRKTAVETRKPSEDACALLSLNSITMGATELLEGFTRPSEGQAFSLRLVVLIDDLDRCLPEKAIQVLESIKLFLNVPGYSFVIAVDDEVVERGIAYRYKDYKGESEHDLPISGAQYLEKIVHLPLTVPRWTPERARIFLQQRYPELYGREEAAEAAGGQQTPTERERERTGPSPEQRIALDTLLAAVPLVPRKLIRLSEALLFERARFEKLRAQPHWQLLHMLRIVALQQLHPALYRLVREDHSHYWRLFRVERDRTWERLSFPDPRRPAERLSLEQLTSSQSTLGTESLETTLLEIRRLLEAVEKAAKQRGAGDPVALFSNSAPEGAASVLPDYTEPRRLFHALYFRGEPVPANAPRLAMAAPGLPTAERPLASVGNEALEALLQADVESRRGAIERLGMRGKRLPDGVFDALVDGAAQQSANTLLNLDWLRDIAEVLGDAQLEALYQRTDLLQRWTSNTSANREAR